MRIAIVIDSLAIGGAQKHVRQLACGLAAQGHAVVVFVLNPVVEFSYCSPLLQAGVTIRTVGAPAVLSGAGLVSTAARLRSFGTEVVVTVLFVSTVFGRLAAQLAGGIPVLTCLQAKNVNFRLWHKAALTMTSRLSAYTVSNSLSALLWSAKHEGLDLRRTAYIGNPVELPLPGADSTWTALGFPELEDKIVIGSLGRLDPQKGYDVLLSAFARIPSALRRNVRVVVFGEGPERVTLQSTTRQLGLQETVLFPGTRTDTSLLLRRMDVYVQPSRFEGTPNALMEAIVCKIPVVASATDGISELLQHRVSGWLVPPGDVKALCEGLTATLLDFGSANERAIVAYQKLLRQPSVEEWSSRYAAALFRLCNLRSSEPLMVC